MKEIGRARATKGIAVRRVCLIAAPNSPRAVVFRMMDAAVPSIVAVATEIRVARAVNVFRPNVVLITG